MSEYLGTYDIEGMASFILEDSKPSVKLFQSLNEMKKLLKLQLKTVIIGFFNDYDIIDEDSEAYSITAWGQFHSTADSLRGHAVFYAATSDDVIDSFKLSRSELPLVYMIAEDGDGLIQYTGEILEYNLSEWILRHTSPAMEGYISKIIKSQPIPKSNNGFVKHLVGYSVNDVVNLVDKDVLVEVYAPWCAHCKKIRSTYDMLGRAASAETRVIISKIDGVNNDIPANWNVKGYPTLLWFPAKDKPYRNNVSIPRPYWDAGFSLYEMASFIQRESSFDIQTLRIATQEQLGQLLADEETLKLKYELEDLFIKRNEGRDIYENYIIDYLFGEVVYDGKRWHLIGLEKK
eukprot:gene17651-23232_t